MKSATHTPKQPAHPPKAAKPADHPSPPAGKISGAGKHSASKTATQAGAAQGLGAEHAWLAKEVGTWDVSYRMWMKPGDPPVEAVGQATFTSVFAGRYVREEFSSEIDGEPFQGIGTMGFDIVAGHFVNTWYDTMGTGIFSATGSAADDGREVTFRGTMWCREQDGPMQVRHVRTHQSADRFTLVMYNQVDGEERKSMELVYTRRH